MDRDEEWEKEGRRRDRKLSNKWIRVSSETRHDVRARIIFSWSRDTAPAPKLCLYFKQHGDNDMFSASWMQRVTLVTCESSHLTCSPYTSTCCLNRAALISLMQQQGNRPRESPGRARLAFDDEWSAERVLRRRHPVCLLAWSYCQLQFAHMQYKKTKSTLILIHIICHIRSMNAVTINTLLYIVYTQVGHSQNDSQTQTHMQNNLLVLQNCRVLSRRVSHLLLVFCPPRYSVSTLTARRRLGYQYVSSVYWSVCNAVWFGVHLTSLDWVSPSRQTQSGVTVCLFLFVI